MNEEIISHIQDCIKQTTANPKKFNLMNVILETVTELDKEYSITDINIKFECARKDFPSFTKTVVLKIAP